MRFSSFASITSALLFTNSTLTISDAKSRKENQRHAKDYQGVFFGDLCTTFGFWFGLFFHFARCLLIIVLRVCSTTRKATTCAGSYFLIKLYYLLQILPTKIWAYGSPRHTERALYPLSYGKTHGKQGHLHKFYMGHTAVMIRNDESLLVLKEKKFHARWWMRRMSHLSSWPTKWQKINPLKRLRSR